MVRCILAAGFVASLIQPQAALRIVVLAGEGAVNIIQQKTAVTPLVEVRERNNLPVAGVSVMFTIGGGQPAAFAGGVRTLTVTTNAAGQAAAAGFNVLGIGAVQIQVHAASQGQIATAAISQTNVATAAAAAGAAAGGGVSATTIGIIGAAVAGGAVVATKAGGGNEDTTATTTSRTNEPTATAPTAPAPIADRVFTGSFSGQMIVTTTTTSDFTTTCISTRAITGTLRITLRGGDASGTLEIDGTENEISFTQSQFCQAISGAAPFKSFGSVTGGPGAYTYTFESSGTGPTPNVGSVTSTNTTTFTGAMSGGVIAGTLSHTHMTRGTNNVGGVSSTIAGNGATSFPVTLRP